MSDQAAGDDAEPTGLQAPGPADTGRPAAGAGGSGGQAPASAPAPPPRRFGCLWQLAFFVVMVALGAFAAATIRGRSSSGTTTVQSGKVGATTWQIRSSVDEQQARCVRLFVNGAGNDEPTTGVCVAANAEPSGADVQQAELPGTGRWLVFGPAPRSSTRAVRLPLTNGRTQRIGLVDAHRGDVGYYIWLAPKGVHVDGIAQLVS